MPSLAHAQEQVTIAPATLVTDTAYTLLVWVVLVPCLLALISLVSRWRRKKEVVPPPAPPP